MISLLIFISCLTHTFAIKCYVDNQGIPVEEADGIIAEFKEFDCSLGGGRHQNCLKEIRESDGQMLIYRNCGLLEQRSGCETNAANVTKCYCSEHFCNTATKIENGPTKLLLILLQIGYFVSHMRL